MDAELLDDAVATALAESDISDGISRLAGETHDVLRDELSAAVRSQASLVESAARDELAQLARAEEGLEAALTSPVADTLSSDNETRRELAELNRLASLDLALGGGISDAIKRSISALLSRSRPSETLRLLEVALRIRSEMLDAEQFAQRTAEFRAAVEAEIDVIRSYGRVRVLADLERWPDVASAASAVTAARAAAKRAVLQRGVLPLCRDWINQRLRQREEERLSRALVAVNAPGLAELPNPDHDVPTPDGDHLVRLLSHLPGGSVGLSGPRGSGKTTLLRSFHQGRRWIGGRAPGLTALVAAPVEYASREFVLHIFERLCLAADPRAGATGAATAAADGAERRDSVWAPRAVAGAGLAATIAGGALLLRESTDAGLGSTDQLTLLIASLLALFVLRPPRRSNRSVGTRLLIAATALTAALILVFVDRWPGWLTLVAVPCLAGQLLAAFFGSRMFVRSSETGIWRVRVGASARRLPRLVVAEGIALAAAAAAGLDVGDRAATGAAIVLAFGLFEFGLRTFANALVKEWSGDLWTLLVTVGRAAATIGQTAGLLLLVLDVTVSDGVLIGCGLVIGGLWWLEFSHWWTQVRPGIVSRDPAEREEPTLPAEVAAEDAVDVASIEALEDVLGQAGEHLRGNTGFAEALSMLSTWRTSGAPLNAEDLYYALHDLRRHADPDSKLHEQLLAALAELDRRDARREAWRLAGRTWLHRIRYQQSFSTTWSGKVGVSSPVALEASRGGGSASAEFPMTLPQIVAGLQDYLRLVSAVEPVVIAIDELDKMGSVEAAERFLNEIKAVFGVPNCYFLISVSEDAVASFERRGLPFRDVVDSSFDEVLRVGYLSLADAESLLAKRVISLPLPFAALCHALSGGLARDLIRTTRALFDLRLVTGEPGMEHLCRALVGSELNAKRDGTVTAIRGLGTLVDVSDPLCWLAGIDLDELSVTSVEEVRSPLLAGVKDLDSEAERAAALRLERHLREFLSFWYLCVTLVEVFADELTVETLKELTSGAAGTRDLDDLARARQSFAIDANLAWERISAVREAWSLARIPPPVLYAVASVAAPPAPAPG